MMSKFTNPKDRATLDSLDDGAEDPDEEPVSQVTKIAPPSASVSLTTEQFQQLLAAATGGGGMNGAGLADAITQGMKEAKEPIPENKVTDAYSALNPLGDRHYPRAGLLKCRVFWGAIEDTDDRNVQRAWEIEDGDASIWEIFALNMLGPIEKVIKRLDKAQMAVKVEAKRNASSDVLERIVIGFPMSVIGKGGENRNMIPDLTEVVYQLTGHDFRQDTLPTPQYTGYLQEVHRLHRAKQYVCPAREVAA